MSTIRKLAEDAIAAGTVNDNGYPCYVAKALGHTVYLDVALVRAVHACQGVDPVDLMESEIAAHLGLPS